MPPVTVLITSRPRVRGGRGWVKSLGVVFFRSGGDDGGPGWSGLRSVAAGRTRPVGLGQDSGGIGLGDRLDRTSDDHLLESPITPTAVSGPGASGLCGDRDLRGAIGTAIFVANPCHPAHRRRR